MPMNSRKDLQAYLAHLLEVAVLLLFLVVSTYIFLRILNYILPFVIGFLIAVSLLPIARFLEHQGMPRRSAIVATLVVILGGLLSLLLFLVIQGAEEATSLYQVIPQYFVSWRAWAENLIDQSAIVYAHLPPKMVSPLQSSVGSVIAQSRELALSALSAFIGGVTVLPDLVFVIVISVIAAYFFMAERTLLLNWLRILLPPGWGIKLEVVAKDVGNALAGLLRAQLVLIAVTSMICVVGLTIMHVHYALILGIAIGLTGWVPILGSGIITIPWAIGAFALGNVVVAIKVILLQAIASLVRHTIEPKILASNMGLGTFPTLFGMYVGLTSIGFIGLLLGPIALIAIRSLLRVRMFIDFFPERMVGQSFRQRDQDIK
ncbi:MAG: sporulation integral membrane protein YtvI [Acidibacillus sp.]|uniref:Sodium-lithium/proton antiporter n=1 Tax=Sulfoacidibacillus ferrooxidans TaxID=2005001 RepID=A0A9X1V849_9BACL|nr:sporulation integral membrane protein YtvI [Sulfoacidibacillus ferrooxidans]MCI0182510.1 Sodium-lithium/proton antiporter [Sulfoacidibacillus ferrooxidans]MCY0894216.1 sporulation integral membrane protein YtvI [Acidibacillus sp.]